MKTKTKWDWFDRERRVEEYETGIDQSFGANPYRCRLEQILLDIGVDCRNTTRKSHGNYFETSDSTKTPERSLAQATIEQAMVDVILARAGINPKGTRECYEEWVLVQTAEDWMMCRDAGEPWGFEALCHILDFDPDAIRSRTMSIAKKYCALVGE